MLKKAMNLGAHVSIAGGIERCFERAEHIGADVIQIFTKNPTQWKSKPITSVEAQRFLEKWKQSNVKKVIAHSSYLLNLAQPSKPERLKMIDAFIDEIHRAEMLGIRWIVAHPGSYRYPNEDDGIKLISSAINDIFERTKGSRTGILLETTSGQGASIGWRFEQLKAILSDIRDVTRTGICFDTTHVFAAGYDIRTADSFAKVLDEFSSIIGLRKIKAIHMSDSLKPLGSRIDRHANIGNGQIGLEAFRFLVNRGGFKSVPLILETPGGEPMFKRELKLLRSIRK